MTGSAALARLLPDTGLVATPALLMNHDLDAERFVRDFYWAGVMASGAFIDTLFIRSGSIVANLAIDPRGFQMVRMGSG